MPTIVTRGAISARGAGVFSTGPAAPLPPVPPPPPSPTPPPPPPPSPVLQRADFTSSGFWTCPPGVFYVVNLAVSGGLYSETPGQWINTVGLATPFYSLGGTQFPGSPSGFYTYAQVGAIGDALFAQINAGAPAERTFSYTQILNFYNSNTGGYYDAPQPSGTITTRGFAYIGGGAWDNRSNAPVQGIGNGWFIGGEKYFPPESSPGTASSAFGYTVAGSTVPDQQNLEFFNNVPVTPGQQYFIQVGTANGYVILEFVQ